MSIDDELKALHAHRQAVEQEFNVALKDEDEKLEEAKTILYTNAPTAANQLAYLASHAVKEETALTASKAILDYCLKTPSNTDPIEKVMKILAR